MTENRIRVDALTYAAMGSYQTADRALLVGRPRIEGLHGLLVNRDADHEPDSSDDPLFGGFPPDVAVCVDPH